MSRVNATQMSGPQPFGTRWVGRRGLWIATVTHECTCTGVVTARTRQLCIDHALSAERHLCPQCSVYDTD